LGDAPAPAPAPVAQPATTTCPGGGLCTGQAGYLGQDQEVVCGVDFKNWQCIGGQWVAHDIQCQCLNGAQPPTAATVVCAVGTVNVRQAAGTDQSVVQTVPVRVGLLWRCGSFDLNQDGSALEAFGTVQQASGFPWQQVRRCGIQAPLGWMAQSNDVVRPCSCPAPPAPGSASQVAYWRGVLQAIAPGTPSILDGFANALPGMVTQFAINTPLRQAHFLAQTCFESVYFQTAIEFGDDDYFNTNYGPQTSVGQGLGNTQPGDGALFRGRGLIQLTGRSNYRNIGAQLGVDLEGNPEQAAQFPIAALTGGLYWQSRNINAPADNDDIVTVTRMVNGGTNGLDSAQGPTRRDLLIAAKNAIANAGAAPGDRAAVAPTKPPTNRLSGLTDWQIALIALAGVAFVSVVVTLIVIRLRKPAAKELEEPLLFDSQKDALLDGSQTLLPPRGMKHRALIL
jgi:predicted chitinase